MDYKKDMSIDESALDVEWLEQSELALTYGDNWAGLKRVLMLAEENIKVIRAELIKQVNDNPDKYLGNGVKPTGPNVEAYYRNHKRHQQAKDEWVNAMYECNIAEIAKNEVSFTRKAALENLVQLHGQNYFAGPKMPRDLTLEKDNWKQKQERRKEINKRVRIRKSNS